MNIKKRIISIALVLTFCMGSIFVFDFTEQKVSAGIVDLGNTAIIPKTMIKNETFEQIPENTIMTAINGTALYNASAANPLWMSQWTTTGGLTIQEVISLDNSKVLKSYRSPSAGHNNVDSLYDSANPVDNTLNKDNIVIDFKFKNDSTGGDSSGRFRFMLNGTDSTTSYLASYINSSGTTGGANSVSLFNGLVSTPSLARDQWHRIQIQLDVSNSLDRKLVAAYADGVLVSGSTNKSIPATFTGLKQFSTNSTQKLQLLTGDGPIKVYFDDLKIYEAEPQVDRALIAADKAALTLASPVTESFTLPTLGSVNQSVITWATSNAARISASGVVTRPLYGEPDAVVNMTATLTKNGQSDTKIIPVTVKAITTNHAIVAVNAADASTMGSLITTYYGILGVTLTDYNALTNKTPVHTALVGQNFNNEVEFQAVFDSVVASQKAFQACDVLSVTTPADAIIGTNTIDAIMLSTANITVNVTPSTNATWKLYSDAACTLEISTKAMSLVTGDNIAYVKVTSQDPSVSKIYTLIIVVGDPVEIAVAAINSASTNYGMGEVIALKATTLGLDLTDYNLLADKTPVHLALFGKAFVNASAVQAAFNTAVANAKASETVIALIAALPVTVTLANKPAVVAARVAYNALTDGIQKDAVTNLSTLTTAEAAIAVLVANNANITNGTSLITIKRFIKNETFEYIPANTNMTINSTMYNASATNPTWMTKWQTPAGTNVQRIVSMLDEKGDYTNVKETSEINTNHGNGTKYILFDKATFAGDNTLYSDKVVFDLKFNIPTDAVDGRSQFSVDSTPTGGSTTGNRLVEIFPNSGSTGSVTFFGDEGAIFVHNITKGAWHRVQLQFDTTDALNKVCVGVYLDGVLVNGTTNKAATKMPRFSTFDGSIIVKSNDYSINGSDTTTLHRMLYDNIMIYEPNGPFYSTVPTLTYGDGSALQGSLTQGQVVKATIGLTNKTAIEEQVTLILVAYKDNKFVTCVFEDKIALPYTNNVPNSIEMTITDTMAGCEVRAFVWENILNMKPLVAPAKYPQ